MTKIDPELIAKLQTTLGVTQRQVYRRIALKMGETHLDRHLAALVLASENKVPIARFATSSDLATIRGGHAPRVMNTPATNSPIVTRNAARADIVRLNLNAISNPELRQALERDVAELNTAISSGLEHTAKTCMVLAGSIAEALLLDAIMQRWPEANQVATGLPRDRRPRDTTDPEQWDLGNLVTVASNMTPRILPTDASTGADQLRQWRNLIHPGRELRAARADRIKPTKERARNAIAFRQFVAKEI